MFGKGALEIFPAELSVDPELIFGVPPRFHDFSYLEAVFVFHLHWYSSELFGKAGPFRLGEGKALGAVVRCLFLSKHLPYKVYILMSLHLLCLLVSACLSLPSCVYIYSQSPSLPPSLPPSLFMLPFVAFVLSCLAVSEAYAYASVTLSASSPAFCHLSEARQFYVVKNVIKAYYLALLCVVAGLLIFPRIIFFGIFDNLSIRILASLYVSNDFVGLFRVEKLATTTRVHHMTSLLFLLLAWRADFQEQLVARQLLYYCYFSALSFPGKLYLGLRFCTEEEPLRLRSVAKWVYAVSCLLNWSLQYVLFEASLHSYGFLSLLALIV